jgi:hypothetical protein
MLREGYQYLDSAACSLLRYGRLPMDEPSPESQQKSPSMLPIGSVFVRSLAWGILLGCFGSAAWLAVGVIGGVRFDGLGEVLFMMTLVPVCLAIAVCAGMTARIRSGPIRLWTIPVTVGAAAAALMIGGSDVAIWIGGSLLLVAGGTTIQLLLRRLDSPALQAVGGLAGMCFGAIFVLRRGSSSTPVPVFTAEDFQWVLVFGIVAMSAVPPSRCWRR